MTGLGQWYHQNKGESGARGSEVISEGRHRSLGLPAYLGSMSRVLMTTGLLRGGTRASLALVVSKGFYRVCPGREDLTEDFNSRYNHLGESHPCLTERGGEELLREENLLA